MGKDIWVSLTRNYHDDSEDWSGEPGPDPFSEEPERSTLLKLKNEKYLENDMENQEYDKY